MVALNVPPERPVAEPNRAKPGWFGRHVDLVLIAPATATLLALIIIPTVYLLWMSLNRLDVAESSEPTFVGLSNFANMLLNDAEFWPAVGRSVFFVTMAVPVELLLGLTLAVLMNRKLRGLGLFRTLMVMPMAMTPIVAGMTWLILYNPTHGLINNILGAVGISGPAWTSDPTLALPAIMVVDIWQWTPFMFLVLSAALLTVPQDLVDAARVDGASAWREFRHIGLPHIRRIALIAALILLIDSWKTFDSIYALTKGGPGTATQTLNFYAFLQGFQWFHLGYAAALLVVGVVVAGLFTWAFLKLDRDQTSSVR